ncbi:MAG: thioredoxin domain-containing protein [Candidatus Kerfeldbacteria bacterium]
MEELRLTKRERREIKRKEKAEQLAKENKKNSLVRWGTVAAIIVIAGGLIVWFEFRPESSAVTAESADPSHGPDNAPVLVEEFSEFQCPACAGVAPVVKDIIERYGDAIRFEYNDFPLPQHEHASNAAVGAQCAFKQGAFWEYHDLLFENQATWSPMSVDDALDTFTAYAQDLGLDMAAFDSCVTGDEAADLVNEDIREARDLSVNATPTFFVNGTKVEGAPVSVELPKAIDAALNQ